MALNLICDTEAIAFQPQSKLAEDLTAIFNKAITVRNEAIQKKKRVTVEVREAFTKAGGLGNQLLEVMSKHTGIEFNEISYSKMPDGQIWIYTTIEDDASTSSIWYRMSGWGTLADKQIEQTMKQKPKSAEEMIKISESFDKMTGMYRPLLHKAPTAVKLTAKVHLDLYVLLLSKETVSSKLERFTAEECAAILTHEIGHPMVYLEHAADHYRTYMSRMQMEKDFINKATLPEKAKYLAYKARRPTTAEGQEDRKVVAAFKKVSGKLSDAVNTADSDNKSIILAGILFIMMCVFMFLIGIAEAYYNNVVRYLGLLSKEWDVKLSDLAKNFKDNSLNERYTDEFVSRHGMGAHLASALVKFNNFVSGATPNSVVNAAFGDRGSEGHRRIRTFADACVVSSQMILAFAEEERFSMYETAENRIGRLRQNIIEIFKEADLDKELLNHYLNEYEKISKELKGLKKNRKRTVGILAKTAAFCMELLSGQAILNMTHTIKFMKQYSDLVDVIDELQRNSLYYRAAKLEQLSQK